jgi:hypothetical protein
MDTLAVRLPGIDLLFQAYEEMNWVFEKLPDALEIFLHYEVLVEHKKRDFLIAFYGDEYFYDGRPGRPYTTLPDAAIENFHSFSVEHFLFLLNENNLSHSFQTKNFHKPTQKVW